MNQIKIIKSKFLKNLFDQNTYVLISNNDAVIIDAGAELEDVLDAVKNKKVRAILITHIHFDHVWNLKKYLDYFCCDVFIYPGAEPRFVLPKYNGAYVIRENFKYPIDLSYVKPFKSSMKFGDIELSMFHVPGHTKDSVAFLWKDNLFSGDLIFKDGIGRTDLPDSSDKDMIESLNLLSQIPFETIYPGHYSTISKSESNRIIKNYFN